MSFAYIKGSQAVGGTPSTNRALAYSGGVTAGNLLVAMCCNSQATAVTSITFTDTQSNSWTNAHSIWRFVGGTFDTMAAQFAYAIAGSSAANTVTAAWGGGNNDNQVQIFEFSFTGSAPNVDVVNTSTSVTTGINPTRSATTTVNNDLGLAFLMYPTATPNAGSGFTIPFNTGSVLVGERLEYKADLGTSGSTSFPFICSTSQDWAMLIVTFKSVAAGGTLLKAQGIAVASVSKLDEIAYASIKSANGLTTGN